MARSVPPAPGRPPSFNERKEENYWSRRKTLRLRPTCDEDAHEAAVRFMTNDLKLDSGFIRSLGNFHAERVPFGPKSRYKNELLVRFNSVEARDVVRGDASNLAGRGSEVGIRLEVPNHLRASMKALQQVAYEIKTKHHGSKRNILFDDECMDLTLDFCLEEGGRWRRLSSGQARSKAKKITGGGRSAVKDDELDGILGTLRQTTLNRPGRT